MRRGRRVAGAMMLCAAAAACGSPSVSAPPPPRLALAAPPPRPYVMFVSVAGDATFKHVALSPLAALGREAFVTPLVCDRVYFAGGRGICLAPAEPSDAPVTMWAQSFNERFERLHR